MMLTQELSAIVGNAFQQCGLPAELGMVTVSDRPDLADFQCNGAMKGAKQAGKNPREVAQMIVDALSAEDKGEKFSELSIAGPGFINLRLTTDFLAQKLTVLAADERLGMPHIMHDKIVIDYGGPNVAKALHVGHMRPFLIGNAVDRMLRFAGCDVVSDVHLGNWGLPYGMLISEFEMMYPDSVYFSEGYNGEKDEDVVVTLDILAEMYPRVSQQCKGDEARKELAQKTTAKMQAGHKGYLALLQRFNDVTIADVRKMTDFLDIHFDLWLGESDTQPDQDAVHNHLKAKGLIEDSQGAQIIRVAREDDNKEVPPLIWLNSRGAASYPTTDLITVYQRVRDYSPDKIIYVTDYRQAQHFEQVFRAADLADYIAEEKLEHIGYGTLNGQDGRPFKTRDGGLLTLNGFISMIIDKAAERLKEIGLHEKLSDEEFKQTADMIAIAAMKFGDLSNAIRSDYIFDIDRFVSFEGKTGPYMQYAGVRIKSVLSKAAESGIEKGVFMIDDSQRALALQLILFADNISAAVKARAPHIICEYLFNVAQSFNSFYQNIHILGEENKERQSSFIAMITATSQVIEIGLGLLGIKIPQQM